MESPDDEPRQSKDVRKNVTTKCLLLVAEAESQSGKSSETTPSKKAKRTPEKSP